MVKKLQKMAQDKQAAAAGLGQLLDNPLAGAVKDSAQQIWLAGLGAFAKAQEEGGKVFEALVQEGMSLQRRTQSVAETKLEQASGRLSQLAGEVQSKAGQSWDKLESIFEQRVAKAMGRLGVPSQGEVQALIARIDALSAQVAALGGTPAPAPRAAKTAKASGTTAPKTRRAKPAPAAEAPAAAAAPARKPRARKAAA